jgi:hypothetical protein
MKAVAGIDPVEHVRHRCGRRGYVALGEEIGVTT